MADVDFGDLPEIGAERNAELIEERKLKAARKPGRDAAVLMGRLYGELEADRRGETGELRDERVRRAQAYAAWEFDGKPAGGAHLDEFGLRTSVLPTADRSGPDLKAEKPVKKRSW